MSSAGPSGVVVQPICAKPLGITTIDPDVQVARVVPFAEMIGRPLARPRFNAFLLGVFGIAALLLSSIGLYAVMGAYVRQREGEIALRLALGATATRVRRVVLAETVRLAGLDTAAGLAGAASASRLVRGMLFEIHPLDPLTILSAASLVIVASGLASYIPARRATR